MERVSLSLFCMTNSWPVNPMLPSRLSIPHSQSLMPRWHALTNSAWLPLEFFIIFASPKRASVPGKKALGVISSCLPCWDMPSDCSHLPMSLWAVPGSSSKCCWGAVWLRAGPLCRTHQPCRTWRERIMGDGTSRCRTVSPPSATQTASHTCSHYKMSNISWNTSEQESTEQIMDVEIH